MAKKKTKTTGPQTAEQKAARAAIQQSKLIAVDQTQARLPTATRGAFTSRGSSLKSGGSQALSRYEIGGFKSDPFPKIPVPGTYTTPPPRGTTPTVPKPKPPRGGGTNQNAGQKQKPKPKPKKVPQPPNAGGRKPIPV